MSIQILPTEILLLIFRFVGNKELAQNCGVAVCQRWHSIIKSILVKDIRVSGPQFIKISDRDFQYMKIFTRALEINMTIKIPPYEIDKAYDELADDRRRLRRLKQHPKEVQKRLNHLSTLIPDYSSLRSLVLRFGRVGDAEDERQFPTCGGWDQVSFIKGLWSTRLAHLTIETGQIGYPRQKGVCRMIAQIIPSLISVRLQLRWICDELLDFTHIDATEPPRIKNIIISDIMHYIVDSDWYWEYSMHEWDMNCSYHTLFVQLENKAEEAVRRLPTLEGLWIVKHEGRWARSVTSREFVTRIERTYPIEPSDVDGYDWSMPTPWIETIAF
jgi:hypothetical protein